MNSIHRIHECPQGAHGWCGTVPDDDAIIDGDGDIIDAIIDGDSDEIADDIARPTVDSGWGYCTDDCKGWK